MQETMVFSAVAMEISADAKAGDGSLQHVGIKLDSNFQLPDCRRWLVCEEALRLHQRFQ